MVQTCIEQKLDATWKSVSSFCNISHAKQSFFNEVPLFLIVFLEIRMHKMYMNCVKLRSLLMLFVICLKIFYLHFGK